MVFNAMVSEKFQWGQLSSQSGSIIGFIQKIFILDIKKYLISTDRLSSNFMSIFVLYFDMSSYVFHVF